MIVVTQLLLAASAVAQLSVLPKIIASNGNLLFSGGSGNNISFETQNRGQILFNGVPLNAITQKDNDAFKSAVDTLAQRINVLEFRQTLNPSTSDNAGTLNQSSAPAAPDETLLKRIGFLQSTVSDLQKQLNSDVCSNANPCQNGATCQSFYGGYRCICPNGWQGTNCEMDFNECSLQNSSAHLYCSATSSKCYNTPGSYKCECNDGFVGSTCRLPVATNNATTPNNTLSLSAESLCQRATQQLCSNGICMNRDVATHLPSYLLNNGPLDLEVERYQDLMTQYASKYGYSCLCDAGWHNTGSPPVNPACTDDTDECAHFNHLLLLSSNSATGVNSTQVAPQSVDYPCSMEPFVVCVNKPGTFTCSHCPAGYVGDGYSCTDVNECLANNGGCSVNPYVECINLPGSYRCGKCPLGYTGDGMFCDYIGACGIQNGGCHPLATCRPAASVQGVSCRCPSGYVGDGIGYTGCQIATHDQTCSTIEAVYNTTVCLNGATCILLTDGNFQCICAEGFSGIRCETDIDDCAQNPCMNGGSCTDRVNSFQCRCAPTFTGYQCESRVLECGGVRSGYSGVLEYPLLDDVTGSSFARYPHGSDCQWTIQVPDDSVVTLNLTKLDLEAHSSCQYDFLQISPITTTANISSRIYCGNLSSYPVAGRTFTLDRVTAVNVRFFSDASISGTGFQLTYAISDVYSNWKGRKDRCGTDWMVKSLALNQVLVLKSPALVGIGNFTNNQVRCSYKIGTEAGAILQFQLQLTNASQLGVFCNYSQAMFNVTFVNLRLRLREERYGQLFDVCRSAVAQRTRYTFVSQTPVVITDYTYVASTVLDYQLVVQAIAAPCGGRIRNSRSGSIRFPPAAQSLPQSNLLCFWSVSADVLSGMNFSITFNNLSIVTTQASANWSNVQNLPPAYRQMAFLCTQFSNYFIEIRRGRTLNSRPLAVACVNPPMASNVAVFNVIPSFFGLQRVAQTGGSEFTVVYKSGVQAQRLTFDLAYSLTCNRTLINRGEFVSPNYPTGFAYQGIQDDVDCYYTVTSASPQHVIQLRFRDFNVQPSSGCLQDFVEVIEVVDGIRSTIRLCGSTLNDGISLLTQAMLSGSGPSPSSTIGRAESLANTNASSTTRMISAGLFRSRSNRMTIRFRAKRRVDSRTKGIKVQFESVMRDCGGMLSDSSGRIRSPNLANVTAAVINCVWIIRAPAKYRIQLKVNDFNLYDSYGCAFDALEVVDLNTTMIGRFCGSQIPRFITSYNSMLLLRFYTRRFFNDPSFEIDYQFVLRQQACNRYYAQSSAALQSPLYPTNYPAELDCITIIHLPQVDQQILLRFSDFAIEYSPNCSKDYLELRNGGSERAPLIGRFCGSGLQFNHSRILSYTNQLYMVFHTDQFTSARGYRIVYEAVSSQCGGTIHQPKGSITSPNYPLGYPGMLECYWQIVANPGNQLMLYFEDFELEQPFNGYCSYDYVRVMDTTVNEGVSILTADVANVSMDGVSYCGTMLQGATFSPPITVNAITIKFRSDFSMHYRGFFISYRSTCSGQKLLLHTGYEGLIESQGYPVDIANSSLAGDSEVYACDWLIASRSTINSYIEIELSDFKFNSLVSSVSGTTSIRQHVSLRFMSSILANCTSRGNYFLVYDGNATGALEPAKVLLLFCSFPENDATDNSAVVALLGAPFVAYLDSRFLLQPRLSIQSNGSQLHIRTSFQTDNNVFFKLLYRATGCGAHYSVKSPGTIQSPAYPTTYSSLLSNWTAQNTNQDIIMECSWQLDLPPESPAMHITLSDLDLQYDTPACSLNSLQILGGENFNDQLKNWCNKSATITFTSSSPSLRIRYLVNMTAAAAANFIRAPTLPRGFSLQFEPTTSGCLYRFSGMRVGEITSPGYPDLYGNNLDCFWYLESPGTDDLIELEFFYLSVESSMGVPGNNWTHSCSFDFISIYDGHNMSSQNAVTASFCGAFNSTNITDRLIFRTRFSNKMLVRFRTDSADQFGGFRAVYRTACGGHYQLSTQTWTSAGEVRSPNYPTSYPSNADCSWLIETLSDDLRITITIAHFDLEASANCTNDYLAVYNGMDELSPPLIMSDNAGARICGNQLPRQASSATLIMSNSQYLLVRFKSNPSIERTGFKIVYHPVETACGAELHQSEGDLISPHYPNPGYPSLIDCEWLLVSPPGSRIELTFVDFRLESGTNDTLCQKDHVEVYSNANQYEYYDRLNTSQFQSRVSKQLIGRYCDLARPASTLTTTRNVVWIKFSSDEQLSAPGFAVTFRTVYDAEINNVPDGFLASPNYPYLYPAGVTRQWRLVAPATFVVRFRIIALELEPSTSTTNSDCLVNGASTQSMGTSRDYLAFTRGRNTLVRGYRCMPNYQDSVFEIDATPITVFFFSNTNAQGGTGFLIQWVVMDRNTSANTPLLPSLVNGTVVSSCAAQIVSIRLDDDFMFTNQSDVFPPPVVPRAVIKSPGYPNDYSNNLNCDWSVQLRDPNTNRPALLGYRYWLNVTDIELEEHENCAWDSLSIEQNALLGSEVNSNLASWLFYATSMSGSFRGGLYSSILRICHRRQRGFPRFPLATLSEPMTVRFKTDYSVVARGFSMEVRPTCGGVLTNSFGTISVPATLFSRDETPSLNSQLNFVINCTWIISAVQPQGRVEVLFEDIYLPGDDCAQTCLSVIDGFRTSSPSLLTNYTQSTCACTQTLASQLLFRRVTSSSREITIRFQYMRTSAEWPRLLLQYRRISNVTIPQVASCGGTVYVIASTYLHHYSSLSLDQTSFSSDYRNLTSPGYPNSYANNQDCTWTIVALPPSRRIKLEVIDLEMETHWDNCRIFDRLDVLSGNTLLGRYCGMLDQRPQRNLYPPLVFSSNNQLRVEFHTDYSVTARGFLLRVSTVTCGGAYSLSGNQSVLIRSPNYGNGIAQYDAGLDCTWIVYADVGQQLRLELLDLKLEYGTNVQDMLSNVSYCVAVDFDKLEVRRENASGPLVVSWCGFLYRPPPIVNSQARQLAIRFVSNSLRRNPELGFRLRVTAVEHSCGGDIVLDSTSNPSGTISSPAYPHNYSPSLQCTWRLRTAALDQRIRVVITDLNMPNSWQCPDYIAIFNGVHDDAPRLVRTCGSSATMLSSMLSFNSTSNHIRIQFVSNDDDQTASGFSLQYSLIDITSLPPERRCGGEISLLDFNNVANAPRSFVLASPANNVTDRYEANMLCVWTLALGDASLLNTTVNVQLRRFSLQPGEGSLANSESQVKDEFAGDVCNKDFFEVREGGEDLQSSRFVARLCGRFNSWPALKQQLLARLLFNSASQRLWFLFKTDGFINERGFVFDLLIQDCGADLGSLLQSEFDIVSLRLYSRSQSCLWTARGVTERIARLQFRLFALTSRGNVTLTSTSRQPCLYTNQTANQSAVNHYVLLSQGDRLLALFNPPLKTYCLPAFPSLSSIPSTLNDSQYTLVESLQVQIPADKVLRLEQYGPNSLVSARYTDWYVQVQYQITDPLTDPCSGHATYLHLTNGVIQSPAFPQRYANNLDCAWVVQTRPGYFLQFSFDNASSFDLEYSANCSNDFLQINRFLLPAGAQGDSDALRSLGQFCGFDPLLSRLPPFVVAHSWTDRALIRFHTNEQITRRGFQLRWTSVCGAFFHKSVSSGTVMSPNYPRNYDNSLNCTYVAQLIQPRTASPFGLVYPQVSVEHVVTIRLTAFDIESPNSGSWWTPPSLQNNCPYDYVQFLNAYDGTNASASAYGDMRTNQGANASAYYTAIPVAVGNQPVLYNVVTSSSRYCGQISATASENERTLKIVTSADFLLARLVTDSTVVRRGFSAQFSVEDCGGVLDSQNSGEIKMGRYHENANCTWLVAVQPGFAIRFRILQLDLEFHVSCDYDALTFYNSSEINESSRVLRLCNLLQQSTPNDQLQRRVVTGNVALVHFSTDGSISRNGFALTYSMTYSMTHGCGADLVVANEQFAYIDSPSLASLNSRYNLSISELDCLWRLSMPATANDSSIWQLQLAFDQFQPTSTASSSFTNCSASGQSYLEIRRGMTGRFERYCTSRSPASLTMLSGVQTSISLRFVVENSQQDFMFRIKYRLVRNPCGTQVQVSSYSPSTYLQFASSQTTNWLPSVFPLCSWSFAVTNPSMARFSLFEFTVNSVSFNLVTNVTSCAAQSMFSIADRSPVPVFNAVALCQNMPAFPYFPFTYESLTSNATIRFRAPESVSTYSITYRAVNTCNRTVSRDAGQLASVNWRIGNYFANTDCFVHVFAPSSPNAKSLSIVFDHFSMETSLGLSNVNGSVLHSCPYDYVEMYNVNGYQTDAYEQTNSQIAANTLQNRLVGRYCGGSVPSPLFLANANYFVLRFHSDDSIEFSGYQLNFAFQNSQELTGCGWSLTSTFDGLITSPAYPLTSAITQPINCDWQIAMPSHIATFVTVLRVFSFPRTNFTANENCTNVNTVLRITALDSDGNPLPNNGNSTGSVQYCADSRLLSLPARQNTRANRLLINLKHSPPTGSSQSYSGFQLHYSATLS